MWAHLWTHKPMPPDYVDLLLCERFHWSPNALYEADADLIERFLVMWEVESAVAKIEGKSKGKGKSK